jgi:hypothetical protein
LRHLPKLFIELFSGPHGGFAGKQGSVEGLGNRFQLESLEDLEKPSKNFRLLLRLPLCLPLYCSMLEPIASMFVARISNAIATFFGHGVGAIAMQNAEIKRVVRRQMLHPGNDGMLQRTIVRPAGKDFVDGGIMDDMGVVRRFRHGQTLPWHAGIEHPPDEVEDVVIAEFAPGATFGYREVRQDKFGELGFRELHGNGRGRGLFGWHGHDRMALSEDIQGCSRELLSSTIITH